MHTCLSCDSPTISYQISDDYVLYHCNYCGNWWAEFIDDVDRDMSFEQFAECMTLSQHTVWLLERLGQPVPVNAPTMMVTGTLKVLSHWPARFVVQTDLCEVVFQVTDIVGLNGDMLLLRAPSFEGYDGGR